VIHNKEEVAQLKEAIDANDLAHVESLMANHPALHRAPLGYNQNGPLTWVAECRGVPASSERLEMARWMIANGSDVHQGADGPLMRAALSDERIPMMELLVEHGADVNAMWDGRYPIICAPCETLQAGALEWLIQHGADPNAVSDDYGDCAQMLVSTYSRNPGGKHDCLDVIERAGYQLPDTAPMAIHRGRIDLLEACLDREPENLHRPFAEAEIYPLGIKPGDGLHCAPVVGGTLLHMAIEYQETDTALWLIERGAHVNAPAAIDADGFGGHTPLFHTTVTLGHKDATQARLLLQHGADPNLRATIRKQLRHMGDTAKEQMREFHDTTAIGFARQFQEPGWINEDAIAAIAAIVERGGK
jgi:ankyrin repeat protein